MNNQPKNQMLPLIMCAVLAAMLFLLSNVQMVYAQKPKGSGAKASTGTAEGGNYVTGVPYLLPRNYHLRYKSVNEVTVATKKASDTHIPYSQTKIIIKNGLKWTLPNPNPAKDNPFGLQQVNLNRTVKFKNSNIVLSKIYFDSFIERSSYLTPSIPAPVTYSLKNPEVVTEITQTITTDTIDRYYLAQKWSIWNPFKRNRLKVLISPSDSGKLLIGVNTNYNLTKTPDISKVHFILYKPSNELRPAIPISETDSASNFYLSITDKKLVKGSKRYLSLGYSMFQYGAVTIPFKYRFSNSRRIGGTDDPTKPFANGEVITAPSESSGSINVAAYVGKKWGRTRFYNDAAETHNTVSTMLGVFAGPSLFELSENKVSFGTDMNKISSHQLALSTGAAFTLEWRTINFGLFSGIDIPVEKTNWVYKYKPWIGFGIGFSLGMFSNANSLTQISGN